MVDVNLFKSFTIKTGKHVKGDTGSKKLIFLPTPNQERRTVYAFHKNFYFLNVKSGHWIFRLCYGAKGGGSNTRASHKESGSTEV